MDRTTQPTTIRQVRCLRCGYVWFPRRPVLPKVCANCNSPYWNKPRKYKRKGVNQNEG